MPLSPRAPTTPGASVEASWREAAHPRVAEEAPVRVELHAAQRHVRGGGHVRDVQPHGDVGQRGALDLVQRARVAQAQGVVDHVVLRRPWVDRQASALVRSNHHVVVVHAQDGGAHAVDEPDGLVEVLGQDHPRARKRGVSSGVSATSLPRT